LPSAQRDIAAAHNQQSYLSIKQAYQIGKKQKPL
jgi:hypothetical protein